MRIILCVTNDIVTDQRVSRIATSLKKLPAVVQIVGVSFTNSLPLPKSMLHDYRIRMLFRKGPLFYAEYNIRLFLHLLFAKADIIVSNDLDTLPAAYVASKLKGRPLIFDSHEYFTGLPELVDRKRVRKIWEGIEALLLPSLKHTYTVSNSIADDYHKKYGVRMQVIRNVPLRISDRTVGFTVRKGTEKLIIYQGALNVGRGLELAIRAMHFIENCRLIIAGTGNFEKELRDLARSLKLHDKVHFLGRLTPVKLRQYTLQSDLGISLEEQKGLNYYYALPNKLFDYIQAQIPVLVSDMPEMSYIVNHYGVGMAVRVTEPAALAEIFKSILYDVNQITVWKTNLQKASEELCWENEEIKLLRIYQDAIN